MANDAALALLIFLAAALYSSIGFGGSTGYLAAMALFDLSPLVMRQSALALNILVGLIAALRFARAGLFDWRVFWPLAVTSVPMSFLAGMTPIPPAYYRWLVCAVLLFAAAWLALPTPAAADDHIKTRPSIAAEMSLGAAVGVLSGLTGVGGAIFLSPAIVLLRWMPIRRAAGVTAAIAFLNSIAGFTGTAMNDIHISQGLGLWLIAAAAGALIGTHLGTRRLPSAVLRYALSLVLAVAALRFGFG